MSERDESAAPVDRTAETASEGGSRTTTSELNATVPAASTAPASGLDSTAEHASAQVRIDQLEREKKETYDRLLRTAADFDNYRKRARRDAAEAEEKGRLSLLKALLPVIDNLERAVAHEGEGASAGTIEGVRLILRMFQNTLEQFHVRPFESVHRPFDPQIHEAVSQAESDQHPVGTVLEEFQRGYNVGGKLLRPAMVVVAKAKEAATASNGAAEGVATAAPDKPTPAPTQENGPSS